MARGIYIVDAILVDGNGTFGRLDGYPKQIDSKNSLTPSETCAMSR